MWILISIPVATICFAAGTIAGQLFRRLPTAVLTAYLGAIVLMLSAIVASGRSQFEVGVLVATGLLAMLGAVSALIFRRRGGRIVSGLLVPTLVAFVLGLSGLGLSQYAVFRQEKALLQKEQRALTAAVENSRTTAARIAEFHIELERKQTTRAALRRVLPETLDVPAFMKAFEELAHGASVRVVSYDTERARYDFYDEATIEVELEGDERGIAEIASRLGFLDRLVHWRGPENREDVTRASLSVFAMPPVDYSDEELCQAPDGSESGVWLWPCAEELDRDRQELSELCEHLSQLMPIHHRVLEYRRLMTELEELESIIARLRVDGAN